MTETPDQIYRRLARDVAKPFDGPTIAQSIEFRRDQYGLNMTQMAALLGLRLQEYSEAVHGRRVFTRIALARAFAIGVPAESLFQIEVGGK